MRLLRLASLVVLSITTVVTGALVAPGRAVAGGGHCPEPQSDAHGVTVDVKEFCMLPTILRIDKGETVTWTNRDAAPHTITGASVAGGGAGGWGSFEQLAQNGTFVRTFVDSGVFPYYCMLHPGMVGAVVVGDGIAANPAAPGTGGATGGTLSQEAPKTTAAESASTTGSGANDRMLVTAFAVGAGVLLVAVALVAFRRMLAQRREHAL